MTQRYIDIKSITVFQFLFFWSLAAFACPVSPFYQIAAQPNEYADKSNAVFLARLCKTDNLSDNLQVAEFQVLEVFKGELKNTIRIINKIETDCSMAFGNAGTNYFVFGSVDNSGQEIIMNGFPSFVPERYAKKMNMLSKLDFNKVNRSDPESGPLCSN